VKSQVVALEETLSFFNVPTTLITEYLMTYKDAILYYGGNGLLYLTKGIATNVGSITSAAFHFISSVLLFVSILVILVSDRKTLFHRIIQVLPFD
jgi:hypothetical protein